MTLRPRSRADKGVYFGSLGVGVFIWLAGSGAHDGEAWDGDGYWLTLFVASLALGLALGSTKLVLPGFLIAGIMFGTHVFLAPFTSEGDGASLWLVSLIFFWPLVTLFYGLIATVGILVNRLARRLRARFEPPPA